jgi:CheY-like chemotaxis protein/HPt (histidine-containing phosphotransfer) domain-containing protein
MGGTLGVKSISGEGSTFWFTACLPKRHAPQPVAPSSVPELHGMRVLCVDDNATNRTILEAQLTAWGMQADCVADGPHALARLRAAHSDARPYALAIFDHQMPDMNGETLAYEIKTDPLLASIPLIMLSSLGQCVQEKATQEWIAASLQKPVRQSQLYDCIARVMRTAATQAPRTSGRLDGSAESLPLLRVHALVAEDNVVNQRVAVRMLERLGCRVDVAADGREALEALSRCTYDYIFMDCQMPEMDGYEATAAIRQRQTEGDAYVPIIAMTAHAMRGDREQCLAAGMDDYVSKPVRPDELRAMLRKWAQLSRNLTAPLQAPAAALGSATGPVQPLPPALDAEAFAALKELYKDGDSTALHELLGQFVQDAAVRIDTLRATAAADDARGLARAAHGLKSSSAGMGALRMAALCQEIEQLGQAGSCVAALAEVAQLASEFLRVQQAFEYERLKARISSDSACEP